MEEKIEELLRILREINAKLPETKPYQTKDNPNEGKEMFVKTGSITLSTKRAS